MFLLDYGDEPVRIVENKEELLRILTINYKDPETMLVIAQLNPGEWYRTSPYSWFCYVPNSPHRA